MNADKERKKERGKRENESERERQRVNKEIHIGNERNGIRTEEF